MYIRTILCPTDLSPNSRIGIACAISLARDHDAELAIFHVIPLSLSELASFCKRELSTRIQENNVQNVFAKLRRNAESRLNSHIERCFAAQLTPCRWRISAGFGDVCQEIVYAAITEKADLIVMAKRHRGLLGRMLSASVSERVSREAPCPVLSVCPPQVTRPNQGKEWTAFPGILQGF